MMPSSSRLDPSRAPQSSLSPADTSAPDPQASTPAPQPQRNRASHLGVTSRATGSNRTEEGEGSHAAGIDPVRTSRIALRSTMRDNRDLPGALKSADSKDPEKASDDDVSRYLDEAAPYLRNLSQKPQAPMTPHAKQALANLAAAVVSNMFGFGIPTMVSSATPESWQGLAYGATLAATSVINPELTSAVTRWLGGANPSLLIGSSGSAISGPYHKIGGDALMLAGNLLTYGGINALESLPLTSPWDPLLKSATSGAAMALVMQGLLYFFAKRTLSEQGVSEAHKLPEIDHNRTLKSGVYLREVPKWSDRTTLELKQQEMVAGAFSSLFGAATAGTIKHFAPAPNQSLQSFVTIFGGIGAYFGAALLGRLAYTKFVDHSGKFANRHAIAASDVAVQHIAKSAMSEFEGLLDDIGERIASGSWGEESKDTFETAFDAFLGRAFRTGEGEAGPAHLDRARDLATQLDALATELGNGGRVTTVPDATVAKMNRMIQAASKSIRVATTAAEAGEPINFAMQDVRNRLRDVQALILQSQYQVGGPDGALADERVMRAGVQLAPVFAALRQFDRMSAANGFVDKLVQHSIGKASAQQVGASFDPTGRRNLLVKDVMIRLAGRMQAAPDDTDKLRTELDRVIDESLKPGTPPDRSGAKLLILANVLSGQSRPGEEPEADEQQLAHRLVLGFANVADPAVLKDKMNYFVNAFREGRVTINALQKELDRAGEIEDDPTLTMPGAMPLATLAHDDDDLEAGRSTRAYREAVAGFRKAVGPAFLAALAEESTLRADAVPSADGANPGEAQVKEMVLAMWRDAENMPEVHRGLMAGAMSLKIRIPHLPKYLTHDAHFHPTSYSGRVNSLSHLVEFMKASGVERTNLAGIPSQQRNPRPDRKYYANSEEDIYYRDHDKPLMDQYRELSPEQKDRFDLSMTGFDVTDGNTIGDEMDSRMRTDPGAYKAVGEVTWKKEIVSGKNPREPDLDSPATAQLLEGAAQRGLPVILHCDRGTPEDKNRYAQQVMNNIRNAVKSLNWQQNDILRQKGILDAPKIKPRFIWAHGAGISRFTAESTDHTRSLDSLLSEEDLKDVLSLDLSWDFIGHDIIENVHDSLKRRNLAPELCDGLQNLLRTYKAFAEEGGRADKCDDMGDLNLASVHRVAAENIRQTYLLAQQDFQHRLGKALDDKATRDAFYELMDNHGNDNNNWLYLFNKHQDRLLFGTDALAIGIKAHGDAAYAMNVRVLNPLYMLCDELGKRAQTDGHPDSYSGISEKITLRNYEQVFDDKDVKARRDSYERYLRTEKKADHSTNRVPDPLFMTVSEVRPSQLRRRLPTEADLDA
ncbi:hypothetical protein OKW41_004188 [Paraburkholderia sp. UCT70]|uniref:hypothetical protein n=1 Tax=Paraburkholderia sp. UCT70 TaxID=2991068 RepID=UPI003D25BCF2